MTAPVAGAGQGADRGADRGAGSCVGIVGASAAGLAVAQTLREEGYAGRIVMIDAEAAPFYDRPPLSKKHGIAGPGDIALATPPEIAGLDMDLRLGRRAVALRRDPHVIVLDDATTVACTDVVIATGVGAATLPGNGLVLRSFDDFARISAALDRAARVVVVGAGVLGCELAALARGRDRAVTLVDPLALPMVDRVGPLVGARLAALHAAQGVTLIPDMAVGRIAEAAGGGTTVTLADGRALAADLALVAIGGRPQTGWLADSGLDIGNGVICDETLCAAPGIWAAGDVANWPNPRFGRRMRIEHRMNATEQGMAVAEGILGRGAPFDPIPFFWTDQYDVKIQVHGCLGPHADVVPVAGDVAAGNFTVAYRDEAGIVQAVLGWNMPRDARKFRSLVGHLLP